MPAAHSFEEATRTLGRHLRAEGHAILAAHLLEVVPTTGLVPNGRQRQLLVERLRRIADAAEVTLPLRTTATELAEAASDAITLRGRTGTVWIAWDDGDSGPDGPASEDPGYVVSWQSERGDDGWWEDGPPVSNLRDALAWARERTDSVIVRPSWDPGTHYWAGSGPDRRGLPPLAPPPG